MLISACNATLQAAGDSKTSHLTVQIGSSKENQNACYKNMDKRAEILVNGKKFNSAMPAMGCQVRSCRCNELCRNSWVTKF
jgi:hypothetical protein